MIIDEAQPYREKVIELLAAEKLPTDDLPKTLDNFIVAIADAQVIGAAGLEIYGNYSLLRSLAVRPDFRSQGIAGKLLRRINVLAGSKGLKEIYLLTETAPDYFERKAYQRISREEVPEEVKLSSEFSHICPESAIVMKRIVF